MMPISLPKFNTSIGKEKQPSVADVFRGCGDTVLTRHNRCRGFEANPLLIASFLAQILLHNPCSDINAEVCAS